VKTYFVAAQNRSMEWAGRRKLNFGDTDFEFGKEWLSPPQGPYAQEKDLLALPLRRPSHQIAGEAFCVPVARPVTATSPSWGS
jgi:hypothetical protein